MKQTEIEFFWPLTEQIPLDLDYTPCEEFYRKMSVSAYGNLNGNFMVSDGGVGSWHSAPFTTSFSIMPSKKCVGHWEVNGKDFQVYREKRPSWIHRTFNKLLLGWVWVDN